MTPFFGKKKPVTNALEFTKLMEEAQNELCRDDTEIFVMDGNTIRNINHIFTTHHSSHQDKIEPLSIIIMLEPTLKD